MNARLLTMGLASVGLLHGIALAYRPFDGTDAGVARKGSTELEVGPVTYLHDALGSQLIVPALIYNYGLWQGYELVAESRADTRLYAAPGEPRTRFIDSALSLKHVLLPGSLQDRKGVSIAQEWSLLLPDAPQVGRAGAEVTTIFSQRTAAVSLHLNIINEFSQTKHYVLWLDPIVEGPHAWRVRPVAEFIMAREFGAQRLAQGVLTSVLLGYIARISDALSIDSALRLGQTMGVHAQELRVGFTYATE